MNAERSVKRGLTPKRQREIPEYIGMVRRMLRAAGRRVAQGDEVDLRDLLTLRDEVERAIETAVRGQYVDQDHSWAYIAHGLGVTRQAAQMRYAAVCRDE
ncbi:MAG: hypothetical protein P1U38_09905 [Aeromicrobium sp.]|uniref:hypothetical protein n=1 Tax=Aeromicrobium sp. TaxID=1871063 RepID=UPI0026269E8D|nr:hypothetical protein [Aeromicrobium sp.]MDF1705076.1 hypothetical protein [Aeromicrobium sp.]